MERFVLERFELERVWGAQSRAPTLLFRFGLHVSRWVRIVPFWDVYTPFQRMLSVYAVGTSAAEC